MSLGLSHPLRLVRLVWTLSRHGALFPLAAFGAPRWLIGLLKLIERRAGDARPGERLATALQLLGPTFIKLGQSLAVRGDLIGEGVAQDLSALQDDLPPFAGETAIETVERELGQKLDILFSSFDINPVAAASIAQVHFAQTAEGTEVAVKILRPSIEDAFARDIAFFYWLARRLHQIFPMLQRLKPIEIVRNFEETVALELDLRLEGAAAGELAENFADDPEFRVPLVDWERTSQRVLTLQRIDGIPIDETDQLMEVGINPSDVLERSARAFFHQVFRDGFFHADLHPGNMFVGRDGVLSPVDFGIMGRLDRQTRYFLADMLVAFLQRDYQKVAEVHFDAGYVPADKSLGAFSQACRSIAEPILDRPQNEISIARLLGQLFRVTQRFDMETQPQLLLLQKTMLVAEGIGRKLDPESNIWILAEPLVADWVRENRGPEARLSDLVGEVARRVEQLPDLLARFDAMSAMISADGLRLHPKTVEAFRQQDQTGRYWRYALAVVAIVFAASLFS